MCAKSGLRLMADFLSKTKRSIRMAAIRGRNNKTTEMVVASLLRRNGVNGWRRHLALPGRPDFAFTHSRIAIFVDGCFWHGCPIHFRSPASNPKFWREKIQSNKRRDRRTSAMLRKEGWRVLRIWEHDLRDVNKVLGRIQRAVATGRAINSR